MLDILIDLVDPIGLLQEHETPRIPQGNLNDILPVNQVN